MCVSRGSGVDAVCDTDRSHTGYEMGALAGYLPGQKDRIEKAVADVLGLVGAYSENVLQQSLKALRSAEKEIKAALLDLDDLSRFTSSQVPGKKIELARLRGVHTSLEAAGRTLERDLQLCYSSMTEEMAKAGIRCVTDQLDVLHDPAYHGLSPTQKKVLVERAFTQINTPAFDFLSNYQLQLLGKLAEDVIQGTRQAIALGLLVGEGPAKTAMRIGGVVKDPEAFRRAGKTVFKTAQQRAMLIARTEAMRAYNQGARKFETHIGITQVVWLTSGSERMCPACEPKHERVYHIDKMPNQPLHPACVCTHTLTAQRSSQY